VLRRHALRNAAVPIVTVIGIGIALLIGGVVVTESVYNIPGLGRLTVDAVLARDFPTIQGVILLFSVVYVMINLLVDLVLHAVRSEDPLIERARRHEPRSAASRAQRVGPRLRNKRARATSVRGRRASP
jgi:ABC-type dipeptide/oligopeptide/nickel transport system permease component